MSTFLRRYTFKLYLTSAQETALREQLLMMGQLWNALLQRREDVYRREGRTLSKREQYKEITELRAECPEWAALSCAAARGVADRLDNAFKAFFRRAKAGAGAQSGYPRYKRAADWSSISFTERSGSGWRIRQINPTKGGWRVYVKGAPGEMKARGALPAEPLSWRTGEILWRDGAFWLSVVCEMPPRIAAGHEHIKISFDLIDEFALVEGAKGRSPACLKEQITLRTQHDGGEAPADTLNLGGDGNEAIEAPHGCAPADTLNLGGDGNCRARKQEQAAPADTLNLGGDGNRRYPLVTAARPADTLKGDGNVTASVLQSNRDRRYVRFSWRWRRERRRIARMKAREARQRRYIHHGWSTAIVRRYGDVTVTVPSIPEWTASPRGNVLNWGANVGIVSELNRHVLGQAPMLAVSMLQYKAEEAGIRCDVVKDEAPNIAAGRDLVQAGKAKRRLRRAIKKEMAA